MKGRRKEIKRTDFFEIHHLRRPERDVAMTDNKQRFVVTLMVNVI